MLRLCNIIVWVTAAYLVTTVNGQGCFTGINLYAGTGGLKNAESNSQFKVDFIYKVDREKITVPLPMYDRPGNDMSKNQGDFWTLDAPEQCVTVENIKEVNAHFIIQNSGNNAWYIDHAILYAELDGNKQDFILLTHNYGLYSWVDTSLIPPDDKATLPTDHIERDNCNSKDQCILNFYVMANSGDDKNAGSNSGHELIINDKVMRLYDLPGDDYAKHKAYLWKIPASDYFSECVKFGSVTRAALKSHGNDAWQVKNAIVSVQLESGDYTILAGNRDWFIWLDGHNSHDMTLKNKC